MSFLKKPFDKLKGLNRSSSVKESGSDKGSVSGAPSKEQGVEEGLNGATNGAGKEKSNGSSTPDLNNRRRSQEVIREEKLRRSMDKERVKAEAKKRQTLARIESENFMREGPPDLTKLYRPYSMNMSKNWNHEHRILFKEIDFSSKFSLALAFWDGTNYCRI
jgi:hypothetical protein